ncbi:NUDIX hydrolase [Geomesophilobacter sediminis]|uniref:NUDIX hydrolase n=1 Tax=Geomesophilobacter sediminis TaxID=2798584 RepID=A0A8J7JMI2_9BACT|nr:NUDIX hydrolase [Geomesophilobacter sediminis]MBJ6726000.1 NUDIX hydrolase [Geomesophilobacter sediminis]
MTKESPRHTVVVGCLVRNEEGKVLLIRHHQRGWEIPQGRVEEGENLVDAVHREVREETGVEIELGPLAAVWSMVSPPPAVIFAFQGRYLEGALTPTGDSVEVAWFTEAEATQMVASSVMRQRLQVLLEFDGTVCYRSYTIRPYQLHLERGLAQWSSPAAES